MTRDQMKFRMELADLMKSNTVLGTKCVFLYVYLCTNKESVSNRFQLSLRLGAVCMSLYVPTASECCWWSTGGCAEPLVLKYSCTVSVQGAVQLLISPSCTIFHHGIPRPRPYGRS